MSKNTDRQAEIKNGQPIDLLQTEIGMEAPEKRYPITVGDKTVELNLEQLMELAKRCLEMEQPGGGSEKELLKSVPELLEFVQQYPGVTEFPEEVVELIRAGKKPADAYKDFEMDGLRKKLSAFEKNDENKKKALGSAKGAAENDSEYDELMSIYKKIFK